MKKFLFIICFVCVLAAVSCGHSSNSDDTNNTLSGFVYDRATNTPVGSVSVVIDGTDRSTTTSADGRYLITRIPSGTFQVRYLASNFVTSSLSLTWFGNTQKKIDAFITHI